MRHFRYGSCAEHIWLGGFRIYFIFILVYIIFHSHLICHWDIAFNFFLFILLLCSFANIVYNCDTLNPGVPLITHQPVEFL